MKKLLPLLIGVFWIFLGCSTNEPQEIDNSNLENTGQTTNNTEIVEEYMMHQMNQIEYNVPNTWIEENSEEDLRYYYPEHGMLMVTYDQELTSENSVTDESFRNTYFNGFISTMDNVEKVYESEIIIDDTKAYQFQFMNTVDDNEVKTNLVLFDYMDGLMAFLMITFSDSEMNYNREFDGVLESIEIPENINIVNEKELSEEKEEDIYYFDGTKLISENLTFTITDYKVIHPGESGNEYGDEPVLAFWYDITVGDHVTDREYVPVTAWINMFEAVQDNDPNLINKLRVSSLPDRDHLDSQMQVIKPGGTVSSSTAYQLTDLETPVTLIGYNGRILGEELGQFDYPVK